MRGRELERVRTAALGFTLLELLVTLAIIGIISSLAVPAIASRLNENRTSESARLLKGFMEAARTAATTRGEPLAVVWNAELHGFELRRPEPDRSAHSPPALAIPRDLEVAFGRDPAAPEGGRPTVGFLFYPLGGSTGGAVTIGETGAEISLTVDALTGAIRYASGGDR
jgi:general secretion pathway protein H